MDKFDEVRIRFASINARTLALREALTEDQLVAYNAALETQKTKIIESLSEPSEELLRLIDDLYR